MKFDFFNTFLFIEQSFKGGFARDFKILYKTIELPLYEFSKHQYIVLFDDTTWLNIFVNLKKKILLWGLQTTAKHFVYIKAKQIPIHYVDIY